MRRTRRPSPFSSSSDINISMAMKLPSFSTVTEPTYSSGPRGGQVLDDEVSVSSTETASTETDGMSLARADIDGDTDITVTITDSNTISNSNSNSNSTDKQPGSSSAHALASAGELAIEDADDSMLLPSLRTNTDVNSAKLRTKTHVKTNQKHKSLGAIPLRHLSGGNASADGLLGMSSGGNNNNNNNNISNGQRRAGGLRHLSLMRKERDRDGRYSRATPSFLDSLVRSVSPTPQMLSSDPTKIIGAQSLRSAGAKKSFSLDSFGQRTRPNTASDAFKAANKTSDSLAWRPSGNSTNACSVSPSNSRGSGMDSLLGHININGNGNSNTHAYGTGDRMANTSSIPKSPRSQNLSSTSLRRVLSLGRPRLDSDAYSAISEPIVYADSAHVADDIWIAPKDLYESERRLAANVEKRKKEKEELALKLAEQRKISHLNRNIEISSVHPEKPKSVISNGQIHTIGIAPKYSFRPPTPDSMSGSRSTLHGVRKQAENNNNNVNNNNVQPHVDLMDIEVPSQTNLARAMNANKVAGGADRHASLPAPQADYQDPTEFNNADMSSRLIKLFFNSGSQNPMPPSTVKRNADLQSRSIGSSRRLLLRKLTGNNINNNINVGDRHMSHTSNNSGTLRSGSSATKMNLRKYNHAPHQDPRHRHGNSNSNNHGNVNIHPNVESMSHDFDLKGRMRGIARLANVRRWLRSRAYRKRRPERRPREVPV